MKVLNARVNWMEGFSNDPKLELLVDKIPGRNELRYKHKNGLWFAEKDGYVSFFSWSGPGNEEGYGGSAFDIIMEDGTKVQLLGPWSSRTGCMNNVEDFKQCLEVTITDDPKVWKLGFTFYAGSVTMELAKDAIEKFLPEACLVKTLKFDDDETYYDVYLKDGRRKPKKKQGDSKPDRWDTDEGNVRVSL